MMKDVFIFIGILFILGCIGTVLNNRRLDYNGKKGNWIKYLVYHVIVLTVIGTVLIDRKLFAALMIIVSSVGVIEMMVVGNNNELSKLCKKILVLSLALFNIVFALFSAFVLLPENVIIYTYTIVLTVDGGGQMFGRLFGKRKITPIISPNKTWGGFIYGSLLALLAAFVLKDLVSYSWWQSLVFGGIVCLSAFSGDILASAYKRAFGAKDFGHSLPGQGGMFDRFDSFLFTGAIIGLTGIPYLSVNVYDKNTLLYLGLTSLFLFILLIGEILYLFAKSKY
jgi:phosphatidate cytidylyltransferase